MCLGVSLNRPSKTYSTGTLTMVVTADELMFEASLAFRANPPRETLVSPFACSFLTRYQWSRHHLSQWLNPKLVIYEE